MANADHNVGLDVLELYISRATIDEGPTMRRFRPRAQGRASRINKRTCHITVIVDRMSDEQLTVREAKTMAKGAPTSNRRARVAASRKATTAEAPAVEEPTVEAPAEESTDTTTEEAGN